VLVDEKKLLDTFFLFEESTGPKVLEVNLVERVRCRAHAHAACPPARLDP
jgi:hypothetical protein